MIIMFNKPIFLLFFFFLLHNLHATIPLFQTYQALQQPHIPLGIFPTPVHKLEKLGALLEHPNIWIKRDDKAHHLFGGNKVRALEFLLADAQKYTTEGIVTTGYAGSNLTAAAAVFAEKLNMPCVCIHSYQPPTLCLRRNALLSIFHKAQLCYADTDKELEMLKQKYSKLYRIPLGGANKIGTIGYVNAALELKEQITQKNVPEPDYIYVACGSVGTTAGLMLGLHTAGLKSIVRPISVLPSSELESKLEVLYNRTSIYLHKKDASFPLLTFCRTPIPTINQAFTGKGFAYITQESHNAVKLLKKTENILLDTTFTGKAFAAMLHDIATKPELKNAVILFWNTYFAEPCKERIDMIDYKTLAKEYHAFFRNNVQPLDINY